jgi:hypothetical protein
MRGSMNKTASGPVSIGQAVVCAIAAFLLGCAPAGDAPTPIGSADSKWPPEKLSAYGLFVGNGSTQQPA